MKLAQADLQEGQSNNSTKSELWLLIWHSIHHSAVFALNDVRAA
jgi:hypothetical protein